MSFGGFVDEFSNSPIQVAYPSNLEIANSDFIDNDGIVRLEWAGINPNTSYPLSQQVIVTSNEGVNNKIFLPNATQASISQSSIFLNQCTLGTAPSSNSYIVCDYTGSPLFTVTASTTTADNLPNWYCFLADNSTPAGTWVYYPQSGAAGSGGATAAQLVGNGYGLRSEVDPLGTSSIITVASKVVLATTTYTVSASDLGHMLLFTGGGSTLNLPAVQDSGPVAIGNGFTFLVSNIGVGSIAVIQTAGEQINGSTSNFVISPGQSGTFTSNGGETGSGGLSGPGWFTTGFAPVLGGDTTIAAIPVNTSVNPVVVPSSQYSKDIQKFIPGTATAQTTFLYPQTLNKYIMWNTTNYPVRVGVNNGAGTPGLVGNNYVLNEGDIISVYTARNPQNTATDMFPIAVNFLAAPGSENDPSYGFSQFDSVTGLIGPTSSGFWWDNSASQVNVSVQNQLIGGWSPLGTISDFPFLSNFTSSASNVGYGFKSALTSTNADTGMYLAATSPRTLGLSAGSTAGITITPSAVDILLPVSFSQPIREINGTASAPSYSFTNATDTGLFLQNAGAGAHTFGLSAGGTPLIFGLASTPSVAPNLVTIFPVASANPNPNTLNIMAGTDAVGVINMQTLGGILNIGTSNGNGGNTINIGLINGSSTATFNISGTMNFYTPFTTNIGTIVNAVGIYASNGTASLPSLTFKSTQDTGMFLQNATAGSHTLGLTAGGVLNSVFSATSTAILNSGTGNTVNMFTATGATGTFTIGNSGTPISNLILYGDLSVSGTIDFTGPLLLGNGSATNPTYSFDNSTNTGMYLQGVGQLGLTAGGVLNSVFSATSTAILNSGTGNTVNMFTATGATGTFTIGNSGTPISNLILYGDLSVSGTIDFTGPLLLGNGSATNPTYSFDNSTNTGMYLQGVGQLGFTAGGIVGLTLDNNSINTTLSILAINGTTSSSSYSFGNNQAIGMYIKSDTGPLAFTFPNSGGAPTDQLTISNTAATFTPPVSVPINNGTAETPGLYFGGTTNTGFGVVADEEDTVIWYSNGYQLCNGNTNGTTGQFQFDVPVSLLNAGSLTTPALNFNYQIGEDGSRTGLYLKQNQATGTGSQVSISCAAGATAATGVDAAVFSPNGIESLAKPLVLAQGGTAEGITTGAFWPAEPGYALISGANGSTAPSWDATALGGSIQATYSTAKYQAGDDTWHDIQNIFQGAISSESCFFVSGNLWVYSAGASTYFRIQRTVVHNGVPTVDIVFTSLVTSPASPIGDCSFTNPAGSYNNLSYNFFDDESPRPWVADDSINYTLQWLVPTGGTATLNTNAASGVGTDFGISSFSILEVCRSSL